MKHIYIPLFAIYVFMGATALVAEEAAQPVAEVADDKPADAVEETGWPREYQGDGGEVVVYQPQLDEWKDYTTLTAKSAVSVQFEGGDEFQYGVIYFKAATEVDKDEDEVLLEDFTITKTHFPDIDDEIAIKAGDLVTGALPAGGSMIMALDRLVADLEADSQNVPEVDVNLDPPPIFYSDQPAILLGFLGEPSFKPVEGVDDLMFAVNTNWDLLLEVSTSTYYLLDEESWMETADPVEGPWKTSQKLPDAFSKLPDDDNWGDVKKHIPGKPAEELNLVFVATEPSELIETDGEPEFGLVSGTKLMYVSNTDSNLFFDNEDKKFYFLTAGRWFRAENLQGPWDAASADLPEEFLKIPADHNRSDVLSAVPGSPDAEAAVLLASVPQKATVSRKGTTAEIVYEGEPEFEEIKGTSPAVSYAINSPNDVFLVSSLYYALVDGVWFVASDPNGPWAVATEVDEAIYSIPEESPKYNATYVKVYDSTPESVVVGYTSGYSGSYVAATGVLMFGLGLWAGSYWNNNRYGHYHSHSHYYGYGSGMRYRSGRGYYRGGRPRHYGPHGGIGGRAGYNPRTGRYYRGGVARGPYGSAFARSSYSPYSKRGTTRAGARTPYGSWGKSVSRKSNNWAKASQRSRAGKTVAKGKRNNLFAGKDGGVYKRDGANWSKHSGKEGWKKSKDGKLDAKGRKVVKSREAGAAGLKDRKGKTASRDGLKDRKGKTASRDGLKDRKGSQAAVKDRKVGAGALKDKKGKAAVKTTPGKQKPAIAAKAKPKAAAKAKPKAAAKAKPKAAVKAKPKAAAKAKPKAAAKAKKPVAGKTSGKKYASSQHKKSGGSTRSNLNRSHQTRSSGNRRAASSSRNRSSGGGRKSGGGGRSKGGGGRGGGRR